jgi:hypothetical protein
MLESKVGPIGRGWADPCQAGGVPRRSSDTYCVTPRGPGVVNPAELARTCARPVPAGLDRLSRSQSDTFENDAGPDDNMTKSPRSATVAQMCRFDSSHYALRRQAQSPKGCQS